MNLIQTLIRFCYQNTCVICHRTSNQTIDLCSDCETELPFITHACDVCGLPLNAPIDICGACIKNPPPFDETFALCHYRSTARFLINRLKFKHQLAVSKILGLLMAKYVTFTKKPDYILPVPLYIKRMRERGFNQSLEIARVLSQKLKIPLNTTSCQRILNTPSQITLSAAVRKKNIKNAFKIISPTKTNHVAILDDVMTTGSTVKEIAILLKNKGVKKVSIWCCARQNKD